MRATWTFRRRRDSDNCGYAAYGNDDGIKTKSDTPTVHEVTLTWSRYSRRVIICMNQQQVYATKLHRHSHNSTSQNSGYGSYFVHKWKYINTDVDATTSDDDAVMNMHILASRKDTTSNNVNNMLSFKKYNLFINGECVEHLPDL
mmetsp:Transcript_18615/g.23444  ORF Transcript_18615/g.23444 Transcript_18615/m.23444 type:complete len:145 (-) Transcript_18615:83-517(-)